jgi:hypothetical protein
MLEQSLHCKVWLVLQPQQSIAYERGLTQYNIDNFDHFTVTGYCKGVIYFLAGFAPTNTLGRKGKNLPDGSAGMTRTTRLPKRISLDSGQQASGSLNQLERRGSRREIATIRPRFRTEWGLGGPGGGGIGPKPGQG